MIHHSTQFSEFCKLVLEAIAIVVCMSFLLSIAAILQ